MTSAIQTQIAQMQSQTAMTQATKKSNENDSTMFLNLMMKQMQYQDPTEPSSNEEWLSQLAQYSTLEEMQNLNKNFSNMGGGIDAISEALNQNNSITQTLALVGKEVTIVNPEDATKTITGKVSEASFDDDGGKITIAGHKYPIGYVQSVKVAE